MDNDLMQNLFVGPAPSFVAPFLAETDPAAQLVLFKAGLSEHVRPLATAEQRRKEIAQDTRRRRVDTACWQVCAEALCLPRRAGFTCVGEFCAGEWKEKILGD